MSDNPRLCPLIGIPCFKSEEGRGVFLGQNASYVEAIGAAGGAPILIPLISDEEKLRAIYVKLDGLLLAGGGDVDPSYYGEERHPACSKVDPLRDWVELTLARWALAEGLPILAICRGIQVLNVAAGGTLYQDLPSQRPSEIDHTYHPERPLTELVHSVEVEPGSRLAGIVGEGCLAVNSGHHQAVKDVAPGFKVAARAPDGVVEAIESEAHPFALGVQWHPEELVKDASHMQRMFEDFVSAARS